MLAADVTVARDVSCSGLSHDQTEMLSQLRSDVLRLGDARVLAALHETLGRIEGKRGLARSAKAHFSRASRLLETAPNVYLQALVELEIGVIAGLELDVDVAIAHTRVSLGLAEQSGSLRLQRACLANLAFCLYLIGDFESAVDHLERAQSVLPSSGDIRDAILETLARIRLTQNSVEECARLLDQIERNARTPDDIDFFGDSGTLPSRGPNSWQGRGTLERP